MAAANDSTVMRRSAPWVVTNVRSALASTMTKQIPVSWSAIGGLETAMPSAAKAARNRSPFGPVPSDPACTQVAPLRTAAVRMVADAPG